MSSDDDFFDALIRRGWSIQPVAVAPQNGAELPLAVPPELARFLASYNSIANAADTVWLNSAQAFTADAADCFAWNEFERMSLEAAEGEVAWQADVRAFWARHLPILMSVAGHYEFVAYCAAGDNVGRYVHGSEPEFEQVEVIALTLEAFKRWLPEHAAWGNGFRSAKRRVGRPP